MDRQRALGTRTIDRLAAALERDPTGLSLRSDPAALAPDRPFLLQLVDEIPDFQRAAKVIGLDLIDEADSDEAGNRVIEYLVHGNVDAIRKLISIWRTWVSGENLPRGFSVWARIFARVVNIRSWDASDRLGDDDKSFLAEEVASDLETVIVEVELVYVEDEQEALRRETLIRGFNDERGGGVVDSFRMPAIRYHGILMDLSKGYVSAILAGSQGGLLSLPEVLHVRARAALDPMTISDADPIDDFETDENQGEPIIAILDGVPIEWHPLLRGNVAVVDFFRFQPQVPVDSRVHGTAICSLVVNGDLGGQSEPLTRKVVCIPILGSGNNFPEAKLTISLFYEAILRMIEDPGGRFGSILIVNCSTANRCRLFRGDVSPWARLVDYLSYHYGLIFVVSAGNHNWPFEVPAFSSFTDLEKAAPDVRAKGVAEAVALETTRRRLLAPAETVNGLTIGAANSDEILAANRRVTYAVDPYPNRSISNPSSAHGPGFLNAVKPDVLLPGGREFLGMRALREPLIVEPKRPNRAGGLLVAAPPRGGMASPTGYSGATSGATALASRLCHRIHDALEEAYGEAFLSIPRHQRAALLKALAVHTARWPAESRELLEKTLPEDTHRVHLKDQVRRFIGFGLVDAEAAVACATDRATFWATGTVGREQRVEIAMPVPQAIASQALPHTLSATLAWLTPTGPGRSAYRSARLEILDPAEIENLRVTAAKDQPDKNQTARGTVFTRIWAGDRAPVVTGPDDVVRFSVQRKPDAGTPVDDPVPFGVAITLAMPGVEQIYEQCRLALRQRVGARVQVP